ncbi:tripartite motif-containing protein 16-like protein isoform X2 [Leuresthes tenuis]|uniref:tripartite motif-containing protein 16-like protein isoform X2 n=1 Tax=Leuresthes tenuis TaxID=355514 RepID=UPI003B50DA0A
MCRKRNQREEVRLSRTNMAELYIPVRKNRLSCQICDELLMNPATMPCGHGFRLRCITDCWDQDKVDYSCPECGQMFPSRPSLIKNTALAEVIKDTEGSEKRKRRKQHFAASLEELKRPRSSTGTSWSPLCLRHKRALDVYCCTDEEIICALCASAEHRGHSIGSMKEEQMMKQEELRKRQTKLRRILQEQEKKWENMGKMIVQIREEAIKTEDYCESILVQVIDRLQRHFMSTKELIGAQAEAAAAQVYISQQTLEMKMEEMKKRDAQLDCLAQTESSVYFLQEWPRVRRLCDGDHFQRLPKGSEDPLLPFQVTKRAVEQLGRHLEEFCDKEFASISSTDREEQMGSDGETDEDDVQLICEASVSRSLGLSGGNRIRTESAEEPQTREEFLQYACELSLDPETAHQDLKISEGEKEVILSPQTCKIPVTRYPQRFIHRRQVLCREGLQAERCYYEIEMKGDKAEIALAYKGLDRKSCTSKSAFGGNAKSWSLDRSKTYSVSHMSNSVQLTTLPCHHRIGVYLNFKAGTLSFYEVLDSMKFLYKVEAKFTEPLYPGFWLGEKCYIRICDLKQHRL